MAERTPFNALEQFDRVASIMQERPQGILCDVDGTLSPIAPTPDEAFVPGPIQEALDRLAGGVDLVAAVSGRPAGEVRDRLSVRNLVIVGNHGFERWSGGQLVRPAEVAPYVDRLARILQDAARNLTVPGLRIENKGPTATLHYRASPDPEAARDQIRRWAGSAGLAPDFRLTDGRRVVEIRPALPYDKGTAVTALLEEYQLRSAIYLGDDWTDVHAFTALRRWRDSGAGRALSIAVVNDEAAPEIAAAADAFIVGQPSVETLLTRLTEAVESKQWSC